MITEMKETEKHKTRLIEEVVFFVIGALIGVLLLFLGVKWIGKDMIMPRVSIASVQVGGKSKAEAIELLSGKLGERKPSVVFNGAAFEVPEEIYSQDVAATVDEANRVGKSLDKDQILQMLTGKVNLPIRVSINEEKYATWSAQIKSSVEIVAQPAKVEVAGKEIEIVNGEDGIKVDEERLRTILVRNLANLTGGEEELPTIRLPAALNQDQQDHLVGVASELIDNRLTVKIDDEKVFLGEDELVSFLSVLPGTQGEVDSKVIGEYVEGLSERFDREPQNAKFEFDGGRVEEFAPGKDGIVIVKDKAVDDLVRSVAAMTNPDVISQEVTLELVRTAPKTSTGEVNNLGITERIGKGESYYAHSIPNRIYNVGLASSRVTGALVAPGEEFSFNNFVGEISGATGYKTAYVISGGRTVLGDGGGVCQVSTTLFRAVMDAGLPITERWAHAYRVGYYEQNSKPGVDATVYSPSKDFKFLNDTPNYILVQAINDPKNLHLIFEIYGTSDGRVATVTEPKVWGVTPPPPDLYEDDPNLPAGTIKQVDWAAWGAKTSFDYKVVRGGETIFEKTFNSNFRPWQNVFLRGVGEV